MTSESSVGIPSVSGDALHALVASLADNKYFLGRRYAEWCTAAPTLESAVAAASMAQDEIGHARSFYPLLRDVAEGREEDSELEAETRTRWVNASFLNTAFEGWTDFVAANLLFDTALTVLLESAKDSSFSPLAQRARRILEEEPLHWLHAEGWTRRLAMRGDGVRGALAMSLQGVAPFALSLFEVATAPLLESSVLRSSADECRHVFRQRVNAILLPAELSAV